MPQQWLQRMKEAMATLTYKFSTSRMVRDYVVEGYLPALRRGLEISGEG
jgi:glucan phosphorylase